MDTTRLVLVRHGETAWNLERRMQGHLDSELTATGRAQAAALAERLRRFRPQALYSSDLGRAIETAKVIAATCGHSIVTDARLRERALGVLEGLTQAEAQAAEPRVWLGFTQGGPDFVVPSGESARQRFDRNLAVLNEIATRHPGICVVVVTHGGTLNSAFRVCTGMPLESPRTFALPNAAVNVVDFVAGRWRLVTWGEVSHLEALNTTRDTH
jgi:2,3-bisphosphoglycerate-dependent phosphoglycerate mutase